MRLIWLPEARCDLREIVDYIAPRDQAAADRILTLIEAKAEQLSLTPYVHRMGRVPGTREAVVHPNYIVIYRVGSADVFILSVIHARQNYP